MNQNDCAHYWDWMTDTCSVCGITAVADPKTYKYGAGIPIDMRNLELFDRAAGALTDTVTKIRAAPKCECGSSAVGSPFHSSWCPLYTPKGVA